MFEKLSQSSSNNQAVTSYLSHYQSIYQHIKSTSDLITFLNWYATDDITKQLEALYKWLLAHPDSDTNIHRKLTASDELIVKHIDQITFIEFTFSTKNKKKHLLCNSNQNSIQINEISQYQTDKIQTSETKLNEIGKIGELLLRFNQNKETLKSVSINSNTKDEIIRSKKLTATSENLHLYHQYLLKLSLNQYHKQVQQQKCTQTFGVREGKQVEEAKQREITVFFRPLGITSQRYKVTESSTHIFNSND